MYLRGIGITYLQTAAYSHESNGVAERYNRTLSARVRPALEHVPRSLWAEAHNWACYIESGLPHSAINGITPYEAFYIDKPSISHLRPSHAKCYTHIDKEKRPSGSKLEPRSIKGCLVGYTDSGKMFRIYLVLKHNVNTVRQVKFEPSSYTSVDVHTPPPPADLPDNTRTIIQELRPKTPPPTTQTTTSSAHRT